MARSLFVADRSSSLIGQFGNGAGARLRVSQEGHLAVVVAEAVEGGG